jgi:hypothetical protein
MRAKPHPSGVGAGIGGGSGGGTYVATAVTVASAGVPLYKDAQELEQLSRTDADRKKNGSKIQAITKKFSNPEYVSGFGSIGGEEFFSYLNISDSLHRAGGAECDKWNADTKLKLIKLQKPARNNRSASWWTTSAVSNSMSRMDGGSRTLLTVRGEWEKSGRGLPLRATWIFPQRGT